MNEGEIYGQMRGRCAGSRVDELVLGRLRMVCLTENGDQDEGGELWAEVGEMCRTEDR